MFLGYRLSKYVLLSISFLTAIVHSLTKLQSMSSVLTTYFQYIFAVYLQYSFSNAALMLQAFQCRQYQCSMFKYVKYAGNMSIMLLMQHKLQIQNILQMQHILRKRTNAAYQYSGNIMHMYISMEVCTAVYKPHELSASAKYTTGSSMF